MSEQTFTTEPGSKPQLITAEEFIELIFEWADKNLKTVASFWAMPGEGWEDSLRTALSSYIESKYLWADLGAPDTRAVYTTKGRNSKLADFVLNGTVADSASDRVIVEIKVQSLGRIRELKRDFELDLKKLGEVDEEHAGCMRLAIGFFFTSDWTQSKKERGETIPAENAEVSTSFTEWLNGYDHVYFSEKYKPIKRKAGTQTDAQKDKAGAIHREETSATGVKPPQDAIKLEESDVHELGIVYKLLPSMTSVQEALDRARKERKTEGMEIDDKASEVRSVGEKVSRKRKRSSSETD